MKKFRVKFKETIWQYIDVQAENEEVLYKISYNQLFDRKDIEIVRQNVDEIEIYDVIELKDENVE